MTVKAFITSENTATITCPACQKSVTKDVSKFKDTDKYIKLRAHCPCGHSYTVFLERRKQYRKSVELRGVYRHHDPASTSGDVEHWGSMTVVDLSRTGIRMKLNVMPKFKVGDRISVEFRLDDANSSLVRRDVIIQNIKGLYVGATYAMAQSYDNIIGFYMLK
ncbi:MAG: PilZ domain-containing protein [Desulfobacteraceae bacterium]|nr:PilZ domain-containing protein [Desulfobacteraceae bacterium]MCF8095598.1 PilZ domain-containing protein [Desulfobacteraceae bacterium]